MAHRPIYIEPLDNTIIEKYRNFKPGFKEIDAHMSQQWTYNTQNKKAKAQSLVDCTTGVHIYSLSMQLEDRLKHIKVEREPRQKIVREFASHLQVAPVIFDSGSTSEGAACTDPEINVLSDYDWMITIAKLPNSCHGKDVVEYIPDKPGFVWLNLTKVPMVFKQQLCIYKENNLLVSRNNKEYLSAVATHSLVIFPESEIFIKMKEVQKDGNIQPAIKYKLLINPELAVKDGDEKASFFNETHKSLGDYREVDVVYSVAVIGWPMAAQEWVRRAVCKYGPDPVIDMMVSGYHLVTKTSPGGDPELDWRISFSITEGKLIDNWTEQQQKCYVMLKTLIKSEIIPKDALTSYHLKTAMFWAVELKPDWFWDDPPGQCVLGVMDDIIHALVIKNLPHYFIKEINLLGDIPDIGIMEAVSDLTTVRFNPLDILPKFTPTKRNVTRFDMMWYFAYIHHDEQVDFSLNRTDVKKFIIKWSKFIIYVAVLTLEDHKMGHITMEEVKTRETLLNSVILVMQEVIKSTNIDLNQLSFDAKEQSVLETQLQQLKSETSEKNTAYQMIMNNFYEMRLRMRLDHLHKIFTHELQKTDKKPHQTPNSLMEVYLSKLITGIHMEGIQVLPSVDWPCSNRWINIHDLSKTTNTLFVLDY